MGVGHCANISHFCQLLILHFVQVLLISVYCIHFIVTEEARSDIEAHGEELELEIKKLQGMFPLIINQFSMCSSSRKQLTTELIS